VSDPITTLAAITTPRLSLRPFSLGDAPTLFAMSREPALGRWIPDQVYRDEQHAAEVAAALIEMTAHGDPRVKPWVLGIDLSGTLIGHVGLSAARGSVEIGYAITEGCHGRGFATEAVHAMSSYGLEELALPEVLGIVAAANTASCRVLEKARFVRAAEHPPGTLVYRRITTS
jgi:RimJ/RimL family protein N-acetyltransferase